MAKDRYEETRPTIMDKMDDLLSGKLTKSELAANLDIDQMTLGKHIIRYLKETNRDEDILKYEEVKEENQKDTGRKKPRKKSGNNIPAKKMESIIQNIARGSSLRSEAALLGITHNTLSKYIKEYMANKPLNEEVKERLQDEEEARRASNSRVSIDYEALMTHMVKNNFSPTVAAKELELKGIKITDRTILTQLDKISGTNPELSSFYRAQKHLRGKGITENERPIILDILIETPISRQDEQYNTDDSEKIHTYNRALLLKGTGRTNQYIAANLELSEQELIEVLEFGEEYIERQKDNKREEYIKASLEKKEGESDMLYNAKGLRDIRRQRQNELLDFYKENVESSDEIIREKGIEIGEEITHFMIFENNIDNMLNQGLSASDIIDEYYKDANTNVDPKDPNETIMDSTTIFNEGILRLAHYNPDLLQRYLRSCQESGIMKLPDNFRMDILSNMAEMHTHVKACDISETEYARIKGLDPQKTELSYEQYLNWMDQVMLPEEISIYLDEESDTQTREEEDNEAR